MGGDLLSDEASTHIWVVAITLVAKDPARVDDLRPSVSQRLLKRDSNPHSIVEIINFLLHSCLDPTRGNQLLCVLVAVLCLEVLAQVDFQCCTVRMVENRCSRGMRIIHVLRLEVNGEAV